MTPFQLLTGVKMRTKQDLEILKLLEEEIVETFTKNRETIREEAKRNILKMQEENCRNFNKKRKKAYQFSSGLHGEKKNQVPLRTAYGQAGRWGIGCGVVTQLNFSTNDKTKRSLRAQAQLIQGSTRTLLIEENERERDWGCASRRSRRHIMEI
ncbi:hypothetical protein TNCV_1990831 [Trichonephila clavipes]|nr:hypothetical protein TNCV_1990831 [Trichonephila clavipes]